MTKRVLRRFSEWLSRQRALPYRLRKSVIKRIHPGMLKDYPFSMDFFGLRFEGNAGNEIERVIYFCGAYEKYMLFFLRDYCAVLEKMPLPLRDGAERKAFGGEGSRDHHLTPHPASPSSSLRSCGASADKREGLTFLDIGANVGNHALFMSKYARVLAFEPHPRVRARLEKNIAINRIANIAVHPFGLGDRDAAIPFYAPPEGKLGNGSFVKGSNDGNEYLGDLQIRAGDALLNELGVSRAGIIKLDVEGFEKNVLTGLGSTLKTSRPLVALELSDAARAAFGDEAGFRALFPENYAFFRFATADRESGAYRLAPMDYHLETKTKDVIACPAENVPILRIQCHAETNGQRPGS